MNLQAAYMDDHTKAKAAYAAFFIRTPKDPFAAACMLHPTDRGAALWVATNWATDPEVLGEMKRLSDMGAADEFLPNKNDLARVVWGMASDEYKCLEDRLKAAKLYAEIRGFIEKPGVVINTKIEAPRVMVVRDHGSNDQWEAKLAAQQAQLTSGAYVASQTKH